MPKIIRHLPFFDVPTTVVVRGAKIPIKADQIIVWVSITPTRGRQSGFDPSNPRLPAILDTGHTHNFSIREDQMIRWAGLDPRHLKKVGGIRVSGDRLPLLEADVWLHPNEPGNRDAVVDRPPYCLELDRGIAVYSQTITAAPRLPLLGLRTLCHADLHVSLDCSSRQVTIRARRRFRLFG